MNQADAREGSSVLGLDAFAKRLSQTLGDFLDEVRLELESDGAGALLTLIDRLLSSGGGRTRPYLCYLGYRMARGSDDESIFRVGGALELFHTFALLHDDVIDEAETRRGAPLSTLGNEAGDRAAMILSGDYAYALSDRLFWASGFPADVLFTAVPILSEMRTRTAAGQFLDIVHSGAIAEPQIARSIAKLKTSSYTFEGPLALGATLAGADAELVEKLRALGRLAGEAFQLRDDLQLVKGEVDDLILGRPSTLIAEAGQVVGSKGRSEIAAAIGAPANGAVTGAIEVIAGSGAVEALESEVKELAARVRESTRRLTAVADPAAVSRLEQVASWIGGS